MNFYKHHIGDYAQATSHLSFVEDAAYSRLLRKYYAEEGPIAGDLRAVQRLLGARTREEREAVQAMLEEFFELEADGWHNKRADEELVRWRAQAEVNRRTAEEREARKRARLAHEANTIRAAHADEPFNESSSDAEHESLQVREPSQKPEARSQKRALLPTSSHAVDPHQAQVEAEAARACLLMGEAGCNDTNPAQLYLIAAISEGITPETLAHTAREAIAAGRTKPFAWAIQAARGRHAEGVKPPPGTTPKVNGHARAEESPLEASIAWARQQHHLGAIDGTEMHRLIDEATAKHRGEIA